LIQCVLIQGGLIQGVFSLAEHALICLFERIDRLPDRFAIPVKPDLLQGTFRSNRIDRALQLFDSERDSRPPPTPIRAITR
jgi:hypothetical protein